MKNLLILLSVVFLITSCSAGKTLQFEGEQTSLKQAMAKAKKQNKPIFIDLYTTWCGPCKMMEKTVFTKKKVKSFYNKNFINLKINAEKEEGKKLVQQFGVAGYPCLIYIDGNGKLIRKELGYITAPMMVSLGKKVVN